MIDQEHNRTLVLNDCVTYSHNVEALDRRLAIHSAGAYAAVLRSRK
jgi:hypothetical protein